MIILYDVIFEVIGNIAKILENFSIHAVTCCYLHKKTLIILNDL